MDRAASVAAGDNSVTSSYIMSARPRSELPPNLPPYILCPLVPSRNTGPHVFTARPAPLADKNLSVFL